jgi:hypothetical protein
MSLQPVRRHAQAEKPKAAIESEAGGTPLSPLVDEKANTLI